MYRGDEKREGLRGNGGEPVRGSGGGCGSTGDARGRIKWRVRKTQSLFTKGIKFHFIKARFESGYTALCKKYDCEYDY